MGIGACIETSLLSAGECFTAELFDFFAAAVASASLVVAVFVAMTEYGVSAVDVEAFAVAAAAVVGTATGLRVAFSVATPESPDDR
mmetsp:Transcript_26240/g.43739  ORF Transcript_26240/g.43739 Transcript_26240/m.43739 type:complete len:86 (+) Transcript_26240:740-997(+)